MKNIIYTIFLLHSFTMLNGEINLNEYAPQENATHNYNTGNIEETKLAICIYGTSYLSNIIDTTKETIKKIDDIACIDYGTELTFKSTLSKCINNDIPLCIKFEEEQNTNTISWKLYRTSEKKFIKGKKYRIIQKKTHALIRKMLYDIWITIFEEPINPFNMFLLYLDTDPQSHKNKIMKTQPFLPQLSKCLVSSKRNIIDLAAAPSQQNQSIIFIQQVGRYMYMNKIEYNGQIISFYKTKSTISSPTINADGLFFIENQKIHYYRFDELENKFRVTQLDTHQDYASIYSIPNEHTIFVSRNQNIYQISYAITTDKNEINIEKATKVTEKNIPSTNMTYDPHSKRLIVSQKINHYYQLVIYDKDNKTILTTSPLHKQDPVISPCQNYISYVAQNDEGNRYIEIIHIPTKKIHRVTEEPGLYRFTNWIIQA
jgi:hypothetical protein